MLNSEYTRFDNMKEGTKYTQPVLVTSMEGCIARNGNEYVKFRLSDGKSTIQANMFDFSCGELELAGIGQGRVAEAEIVRRGSYFNIEEIHPSEDPDVSVDDFICKAPGNPEDMFEGIITMMANNVNMENEEEFKLWEVADEILHIYKNEYMTSAAAKYIHHACKYGLLYHSYRMTVAAEKIAAVYPDINSGLVVIGAALHDIGKLREMETDELGETEYTPEGRLFGHAVLGVTMVNEVAEKMGCQCNMVEMLKHIIASHHGKCEYGACTVPALPEAVAVNMLDNLDAKMYQMEEVLETIEPGELSKKVYGLENSTVYKMPA